MRAGVCLFLGLLVATVPLDAQSGARGSGWAVAVGPRAGLELDTSTPAAGGHLRIRPPWPGFMDLQASANWTFFDGLTERQVHADVLLTRAGVAIGGGPVWMNTEFPDEAEARTEVGWSLVIVAGGNPTMDSEWYTPVIEFRVSDVDVFTPRHLTVGFAWPFRF